MTKRRMHVGETRVLVTSSRTWTDQFAVWDALDEVARVVTNRELTIVHGGAEDGGDRFADEWVTMQQAFRRYWIRRQVFRPRYDLYPRHVAPQKRNEVMVAASIDLCLAFMRICRRPSCSGRKLHPTHGAGRTAQLARSADITVIRWGFDESQPVIAGLVNSS